MSNDFEAALNFGLQNYPRNCSRLIEYGTAGFRDKSCELSHVMYRMGLLAVLRSKAKNGSVIGLMITASHNPEEDNGVKLCDPLGDMLSKDWELFATQLVNAKNEDLAKSLNHILTSNVINYDVSANVYLAKDTRSSSPFLAKAALDGINILHGNVKDFGLLTTPQLHYVVCCKNNETYGMPTEEGYYTKLSDAFECLKKFNKSKQSVKYNPELRVDGANGVGAVKLKQLLQHLKTLKVRIFNDGSAGALNHKCGADFVKVEQKPPEGLGVVKGVRYASVDGDGDRLVYFYEDDDSVFHLVDGSKIATLMAKYLKELVEKAELDLQMKFVQTAYANGSSTDYAQSVLGIPSSCVPTGVKYLHHEAKQCDVGIYFEANGHGTVVFSDKAKATIKQASVSGRSEVQKQLAKKLLNAIDVINETVGDALSDMLLVEAILSDLDWDIDDWNSMYTDYPNKQLKVKVPDRQVIATADAERRCVEPVGLQEAIDAAVARHPKGRAFVRPSGTEDIVRVYAEADSQKHADDLAEEVKLLVQKFTSK